MHDTPLDGETAQPEAPALPSAADLRAYMTAAGWEPEGLSGPLGGLWAKRGSEFGVPHDDDPDLIRGALDRLARAEGLPLDEMTAGVLAFAAAAPGEKAPNVPSPPVAADLDRATIDAETPDAESPAPVPAGPGEASRGALKRVQALAVSWATLTAAEERHELDAEVSARLGRHLLDVIHGGAGDAAYRVNLVARVAESWVTPGGPGVFYPAAGQAVLDAIRGASTETEADWQARAEAAEAKLAAWSAHRNAACAALRIAETASRYGNAPVTADRYRAAREALEGGEGDGRT